MQFTCSHCGQTHDLTKVSLVAPAPAQWNILTPAERSASVLTPDQCVVHSKEGTSRYLRASLDIPVQGTGTPFTWGVWVSLSERSWDEISDHWDDPARTAIGPHFGWLCTPIPTYPDTMFLKTMVHQRRPGLRPLVELERTDHPLAIHQREGVPADDLQRRVVSILHPSGD